jgi:hypothetical protein
LVSRMPSLSCGRISATRRIQDWSTLRGPRICSLTISGNFKMDMVRGSYRGRRLIVAKSLRTSAAFVCSVVHRAPRDSRRPDRTVASLVVRVGERELSLISRCASCEVAEGGNHFSLSSQKRKGKRRPNRRFFSPATTSMNALLERGTFSIRTLPRMRNLRCLEASCP